MSYITFTKNRQLKRITIREHDEATGKILAKFQTVPLVLSVFREYSDMIDSAGSDFRALAKIAEIIRTKFLTNKIYESTNQSF